MTRREMIDKCFNEASAFQRRKRDEVRTANLGLLLASMRPPLFSGGNGCLPLPRSATPSRFNEASAFQRRTLPLRHRSMAAISASMRPPLFSGGNADARRLVQSSGLLQ